LPRIAVEDLGLSDVISHVGLRGAVHGPVWTWTLGGVMVMVLLVGVLTTT